MKDIIINDTGTKKELPFHVILGAGDYLKFKNQKRARVGEPGEPIAEMIKLGWIVIYPGQETFVTKMLFSKTSVHDCENLCNLDVLGVNDEHRNRDEKIYNEFQKQLARIDAKWYETNLIWKEKHPPLNNNKSGSLGRLNNLLHNLSRDNQLETYDDIIREQQKAGIVETVDRNTSCQNREFYMPHKAVIRESAQTTKVRIVYDASAKPNSNTPLLNDCLETGPSLQNFLWDILVRTRLRPVLLCGDIEKAFLQIRIRENDRDALRFHWIQNRDPTNIEILQFTRLVFGLTQSPFILEGTLKNHFENYQQVYAKIIEVIENDMYVDDLVTGGESLDEVKIIKEKSIELFKKGGFNLHKWNSNVPSLESKSAEGKQELTYAKQILSQDSNEIKILGLCWNKEKDNISVVKPTTKEKRPTKTNILSELASVSDAIGLISPSHLIGKILYREVCELKIPWDEVVPLPIKQKWDKWKLDIETKVEIPRSIPLKQESVTMVDLHVFGDASVLGCCAAAYVVVYQPSSVN